MRALVKEGDVVEAEVTGIGATGVGVELETCERSFVPISFLLGRSDKERQTRYLGLVIGSKFPVRIGRISERGVGKRHIPCREVRNG